MLISDSRENIRSQQMLFPQGFKASNLRRISDSENTLRFQLVQRHISARCLNWAQVHFNNPVGDENSQSTESLPPPTAESKTIARAHKHTYSRSTCMLDAALPADTVQATLSFT